MDRPEQDFRKLIPTRQVFTRYINLMASIVNDPNGRKRILFLSGDSRKAIRLGKVTTKQAEAFKVRVEQLASARLGHPPDDDTLRWLSGLDDQIHTRLVNAGLARPRKTSVAALGAFLTELFTTLNVKPNTLRNYAQARKCLEEHFGLNRSLREIEPLDADQYKTWLRDVKKLSEATVSKWIIIARQMFKRAVKWRIIHDNPFTDVKSGSQTNKSRMFFVEPDAAQAVLNACPDAEWKLMFALSRYGGLRCPSEHLALKWSDIDWERNRIMVPSSKTAHHEGGDVRMVPLFPELRPYLLEVFERAEEGSVYVITRYRDTRQNLRTQLCRIIRKAGLSVWPKPWHNLRSTRQTELSEKYPIHVVCAWLGNSRVVAQQHYLQVTDAHFKLATSEGQTEQKPKAAQKAAQSTSDHAGRDQTPIADSVENPPNNAGKSDAVFRSPPIKRSQQEPNNPQNTTENPNVQD